MTRLASPLLVAIALALAGCASKPTAPAPAPAPEPTPIKSQEATPEQRAQIRTELAAGYYERGQMDIALQELGNAKALDPTYAKIYDIYGLVYAMLGERAKAEESFKQAITLAPDNSEFREIVADLPMATPESSSAVSCRVRYVAWLAM